MQNVFSKCLHIQTRVLMNAANFPFSIKTAMWKKWKQPPLDIQHNMLAVSSKKNFTKFFTKSLNNFFEEVFHTAALLKADLHVRTFKWFAIIWNVAISWISSRWLLLKMIYSWAQYRTDYWFHWNFCVLKSIVTKSVTEQLLTLSWKRWQL